MHRESHNVCQKLFLYEKSVAFLCFPPLPVTGHVLRVFFVCVGVRVSVCALALPLIANGSSFIPPPTLFGPRNLVCILYICKCHEYFIFHFSDKSNFPNCLQPNCQRIIHSRLIANAQRETVRHKK